MTTQKGLTKAQIQEKSLKNRDEIRAIMGLGLTMAQIAERVGITVSGVQHHLRKIEGTGEKRTRSGKSAHSRLIKICTLLTSIDPGNVETGKSNAAKAIAMAHEVLGL